jgi:hypothetical protein
VKIDNTPRAWTGGVFDDFGDSWRWLHDLADNEAGRAAFKLGEWAHFRIECLGPAIKVWVNGVPTCHLWDEKYREGYIAFKIHSVGDKPNATRSAIRLRNIRIITEHPERYAKSMDLLPRRAPVTAGQYDKAVPAGRGWTDTYHPDYIAKVTDFGERADWSHDGKRILFVERSFGDVYEFEIETGRYKPLTHHYYHGGYVRALYLSNGDILLSGPEDFPGTDWRTARFKLSELWVLSRDLDRPPARLGEICWEGPAASRTQLRIAWAQYEGDIAGKGAPYQLKVADLDYTSGEPRLVHTRVVLKNDREPLHGMVLEPQNFRPGKEHELTVQAYPNCDVFGLNLQTGELVNYSDDPQSYDEPEGIFPDGEHTLVESSRHNGRNSGGHIDLWKLKLEVGNPSWERITWFNEDRRYKASNPVVSDDGRFIAFQVPTVGEVAGIGHGLYVLDLEAKQRQDAAQGK